LRRRTQSGLTLIEVLIAVSLLSMLSAGVLLSMRMGLSALGRTNERLISNRRVVGAQRILQQQLQGFMPAVAECGESRTRVPFFQGGAQSMRFVSTYSLEEAWRGHARILEFQVIPGDQGRGVRLVVNEHLYAGPRTAGPFCAAGGLIPAVQAGPQSFVLADKFASCRFVYQEQDVWVDQWKAQRWPRAVRVEMAPLDEDSARLRPVTVTALLHVDRYPIFEYGDYAY